MTIQRHTTHPNFESLRTYAAEGVGSANASNLTTHLSICESCFETYLNLLLQQTTSQEFAVPEWIWLGVHERLQSMRNTKPQRRLLRLLVPAVICLLLLSFITVVWIHLRPPTAGMPTLDFGSYLIALEHSTDRAAVAQLQPEIRGATLRNETSMTNTVPEQIQNYHLVRRSQWHSRMRMAPVDRFLYQSASDTFVLFSAPRGSAMRFGQYELTPADQVGRRCRRVTCPKQDVYVWPSATHDYVFVHKKSSMSDSETLVTQLMEEAK
jgi:hypothetical protein